jgi:hypothetical protein
VNQLMIQALLGHTHLKTTARYPHLTDTAARSTKSPLETLGSRDLIRSAGSPRQRFRNALTRLHRRDVSRAIW